MRLWSLHPKYLDRQGLTACWREGLLAQKVLQGDTKGYKNHPQLLRFKATPDPEAAIAAYLHAIVDEAERRGYNFDRTKLPNPKSSDVYITVTSEQLAYEWHHLTHKLQIRSLKDYERWQFIEVCEPHPIFAVVPGEIEKWEKL